MKSILFTKKIANKGLLKREINAFWVSVVCGNCGKSDHHIVSNPKEFGWIFVWQFKETKISSGGAWFCCERCRDRQFNRWEKYERESKRKR